MKMSNSNYGNTPTTSTLNLSTSGSSGGSNTCNRFDMQDINYLLYLETMRRMKEDESKIRRQIEEKTRHFEDVKNEYASLYSKFAEIYNLAATHHVLEKPNCVEKLKLEEADRNTQNIMNKIKPGKMLEVLDIDDLKVCKEHLKNGKKYENVEYQSKKLTEQKECANAIKAASENLESAIECATLQSINYYVEELQFLEKPQNE